MKPLIRLFLFAVARLGLCLAVVAWIVGQWYELRIQSQALPQDARVTLTEPGWIVVYRNGAYVDYVRLGYDNNWTPLIHRNDQMWTSFGDGAWEGRGGYNLPGLFLWPAPNGPDLYIEANHWFITSTFLAFNLILLFTYRKRPEAELCED